jgi:hypothetical protein
VVIESADRIASAPKLARPVAGGQDDLNAALPERFFLLQDDLHSRAGALVDAARAKNDKRLGQAFGRLTETCVECHSAYVNK